MAYVMDREAELAGIEVLLDQHQLQSLQTGFMAKLGDSIQQKINALVGVTPAAHRTTAADNPEVVAITVEQGTDRLAASDQYRSDWARLIQASLPSEHCSLRNLLTTGWDTQSVAASSRVSFCVAKSSDYVKTALVLRSVMSQITVAPATIGGVMLGSAKGPHIVQSPYDWFAEVGDVGNGEHLKGPRCTKSASQELIRTRHFDGSTEGEWIIGLPVLRSLRSGITSFGRI